MAKHKRAHKWAFPLGVILTALAVVGVVTLGRLAWGGIRQRIDNPKEKLEYEKFLTMIILHDPDPFDSVGAVSNGNIPQLLDISIWAILHPWNDTKPAAPPPTDDNGNMLIKEADVEAEYVKIFGEKPPRHASIEGSDYGFVYDPEAKVYLVPSTGSLSIYFPRVRPGGIKKTGNTIELTVDYLVYNDFKLDGSGLTPEDPDPAKTMLITLYAQAVPGYPYRVSSITQMPS